jgi:tripartite-type tricarboxylate transporter receptor subunit TctC
MIVLIAIIRAMSCNTSKSDEVFPTRPIKLVVPLAAGGGMDALARIVARGMAENLGQQIVVENRGGGGGRMASADVAHSPPDGYTLIFDSPSSAVVNGLVFHNLSYNPVNDFAPVSLVTRSPLVLLINPSVPATTLPDFIALLKANPSKYSYGSSGIGSAIQLVSELFKSIADVEIVHVPYRGNGPALIDLLGGRIDMLIDGVRPELGNIRKGAVRALAVSTTTRSAALPDVPTMIEAGVPDYDFPHWTAIFAPAGTPRPVIDRIQLAVASSIHRPDFEREFGELGYQVVGSTPEELSMYWHQQIAHYSAIVQKLGLRLDAD